MSRERIHPPQPGFRPENYKIRGKEASDFVDPEGNRIAQLNPAEIDPRDIETQCGMANESQHVEQYDGTLGVDRAFTDAHQAPVGQLQWNNNLATIFTNPGNVNGERWCSGTLIARDLFLTAGHCFDPISDPFSWTVPRINGTSDPIPPADIARNMHVNFNFQRDPSGNLRAEQQFAITDLLEYRLGGLDYAIVRLAGNPGDVFGTTLLSRRDAIVGDISAIIGHPAGLPKQIEAGPISAVDANQIRYNDTDTLGGNSGSGILLNPDGTIAGVHTNGGCTTTGGFNFGQRIGALRAASPILKRIILPAADGWVAAWGPNRLDIFGVGTNRDMFHKAWDGGPNWFPSKEGWEPLGGKFGPPGGIFSSPSAVPAVAAWGPNRLDIFGVGTNRDMFHKAWDGGPNWFPSNEGWEPLGGKFVGPPAVAAWGPNRLDIFGVGANGDMFHKAWDGGPNWFPSKEGWEPLGGIFSSPPAVVSWGPNRLDIFALGADGQMFHKAWDGGPNWFPSKEGWEPLGGVFTSPPAVVSWGPNRLDIFALGTDRQMFHKAWDGGPNWFPSNEGWEPLGGIFTEP